MRRDHVLYGEPGPDQRVGRPRVHGDRFAFKEPETRGEPDGEMELEDERWGKVRLRRWDNKHACQEAETVLSIILVETHLECDKPSDPFWLAYQPPLHQEPGDQDLVDLRHWYDWRWPVVRIIRFREQYLYWTTPRFQEPEKCDRWTSLVAVAQRELFLARDVVNEEPLPWQLPQERLTPERTL